MYNPQLDTFIQVADAGSFSKAAERMFISPTAVIKQINSLEKHLDLVLFERSHRGLKLTEAGESLYHDAKYLIQYSKDSVVRAQNAMMADENLIRVGISSLTPARNLLHLWPEIHKLCPDLKFEMVPFDNEPASAKRIMSDFGNEIDLVASIYDEKILKLMGCSALKISDATLQVAVSQFHPLASKTVLSLDDMKEEKLMLPKRGWYDEIDRLHDFLETQHPEILLEEFPYYSLSVFNQCENSSDMLLSASGWENVHPMLHMIPVDWEYTIPFGVLHSPIPSRPVKRFLNAVQDNFVQRYSNPKV